MATVMQQKDSFIFIEVLLLNLKVFVIPPNGFRLEEKASLGVGKTH